MNVTPQGPRETLGLMARIALGQAISPTAA
jgi:hypothetical protein